MSATGFPAMAARRYTSRFAAISSALTYPVLLGDPAYYRRFGFELSNLYQITPPKPEWQPHFQVRVLTPIPPPAARHIHLPRTLRPHLSHHPAGS